MGNGPSGRGSRQTTSGGVGNTPQPGRSLSRWLLILLLLLGLGLWWWQAQTVAEASRARVDYSQFYGWVVDGKVESITIKAQDATGTLVAPTTIGGKSLKEFRTTVPVDDRTLMPLLHEKHVRIRIESGSQSTALQLLFAVLPWVLILGGWLWLSRRAQRVMGNVGGLGGVLKSRSRKFERDLQVNVTFDDVAGLKAAKQDLQEIVLFLKNPEQFRKLGARVPRGVLLVGPPGTGKTLLARAVAGQSRVPFYSISASEFIELFVGVGAARVRDLFDEAKRDAPAIIFIDEIDAVGRSRGAGLGGGHDEREQTLNQLLAEMDGFQRRDMLVVLAATNRPDVLDPALLRPGRFDRRVIVERPELSARRAILEVHARGKPLARDVDLQALAENTPGFSGADLANLVNEAALGATRRGADAIAQQDFNAAFDKIVLGDPRETKLDPVEKRRVAVHEAGHAVVARFSPAVEPLNRVSILPRGMALGATQQTPAADRHIMTQPELLARLRVLLGGLASERLLLGSGSTGVENDLKQATALASRMIAQYGMSASLGPAYYEHGVEHPFLGQRVATDGGVSDATTHTIESEARRLLSQALDGASDLLKEHRDALERLIEALLTHETLERDELKTLLGESPASQPDAAPPSVPSWRPESREPPQAPH